MIHRILQKKPVVLMVLIACLLLYLFQWYRVPSQLSRIVNTLSETMQSNGYFGMFAEGSVNRGEISSAIVLLNLFLSPMIQLPCEFALNLIIICLISLIVFLVDLTISKVRSTEHITLRVSFKASFFSLYIDAAYYLLAAFYIVFMKHDISIDTVVYLIAFFVRLVCKIVFIVLMLHGKRKAVYCEESATL